MMEQAGRGLDCLFSGSVSRTEQPFVLLIPTGLALALVSFQVSRHGEANLVSLVGPPLAEEGMAGGSSQRCSSLQGPGQVLGTKGQLTPTLGSAAADARTGACVGSVES